MGLFTKFWDYLPHLVHDYPTEAGLPQFGINAMVWHHCHTVEMLVIFWASLPHSGYISHNLGLIATLFASLPYFGHVCHVWGMFAIIWASLLYFGHLCYVLGMIATLWASLAFFGHVCLFWHLWDCLPCFGYVLDMFALFWAWLPQCVHVCNILSIITTQWIYLPNFGLACMFGMFWA